MNEFVYKYNLYIKNYEYEKFLNWDNIFNDCLKKLNKNDINVISNNIEQELIISKMYNSLSNNLKANKKFNLDMIMKLKFMYKYISNDMKKYYKIFEIGVLKNNLKNIQYFPFFEINLIKCIIKKYPIFYQYLDKEYKNNKDILFFVSKSTYTSENQIKYINFFKNIRENIIKNDNIIIQSIINHNFPIHILNIDSENINNLILSMKNERFYSLFTYKINKFNFSFNKKKYFNIKYNLSMDYLNHTIIKDKIIIKNNIVFNDKCNTLIKSDSVIDIDISYLIFKVHKIFIYTYKNKYCENLIYKIYSSDSNFLSFININEINDKLAIKLLSLIENHRKVYNFNVNENNKNNINILNKYIRCSLLTRNYINNISKKYLYDKFFNKKILYYNDDINFVYLTNCISFFQ